MNRLVLLLLILLQISCYPEKDIVITISGKIIDSPLNRDLSKFELTARSIFGTTEKTLCTTYLDSQGNFSMQYLVGGNYVGDNLRISVYPQIGAQKKFEFLPYGESWNKFFYIGDSSTVVIKLSGDYSKIDTLRLFLDIGAILFQGPLQNSTLGTFKFGNYNQYVFYRFNPTNKFIYYEPTGDPIVDTITLNINP